MYGLFNLHKLHSTIPKHKNPSGTASTWSMLPQLGRCANRLNWIYSDLVKYKVRIICIGLTSLYLTACSSGSNDGANGENADPVPASYLELNDFYSGFVYPIAPGSINAQLNNIDYFRYDQNLASGWYTYTGNVFLSSLPDCPEIIPPEYLKNSNGTFSYSFSFEVKRCYQNVRTSEVIVYEKYNYSAVVDDIVFVDESGNTLDVRGYNVMQVPGRFAKQYNIKYILTITTYDTVANVHRTHIISVAVHGKDDINAPCVFSDILDDCVYRKIEQKFIDDVSDNNDLLLVIDYNNVTKPADTTIPYNYYQSGNIHFRRSNWAGVVEYLGEGQLPAYEVTNGEVVLTGFLQDLASQ